MMLLIYISICTLTISEVFVTLLKLNNSTGMLVPKISLVEVSETPEEEQGREKSRREEDEEMTNTVIPETEFTVQEKFSEAMASSATELPVDVPMEEEEPEKVSGKSYRHTSFLLLLD